MRSCSQKHAEEDRTILELRFYRITSGEQFGREAICDEESKLETGETVSCLEHEGKCVFRSVGRASTL